MALDSIAQSANGDTRRRGKVEDLRAIIGVDYIMHEYSLHNRGGT
jgi:hypothetical protein